MQNKTNYTNVGYLDINTDMIEIRTSEHKQPVTQMLYVAHSNHGYGTYDCHTYIKQQIILYNNIYLFKVQYPMYIKIRVQWTYNDIHNNHSRYTL